MRHTQFSKYTMQSNHSWLEMKVELVKINTWAWKERHFKLREHIKRLKFQMANSTTLMQKTEDSKPLFLKA